MNRVDNLESIRAHCASAPRVLDVGGSSSPCVWATHIIDLCSPNEAEATKPSFKGPWGDGTSRLHPDGLVRMDICDGSWPYPDNHFDFCLATGVLEDVRDPIHVVKEMSRVARAGYVECPSPARELFAKDRFFRLRMVSGRPSDIGWDHHRWIVLMVPPNHIRFLAKTFLPFTRPEFRITRGLWGRKLNVEESSDFLFWEGEITAEEVIAPGRKERESSLRAILERLPH